MHASADLHIVPEMSANLWTVKLLISEILQKRMSKKSLLPYKSTAKGRSGFTAGVQRISFKAAICFAE